VINPDGFQGDERDVVYYSLSYDAGGMTLSQLSARQAEREHVQGMLNVAFTRPRDEVHIFHSAPIEAFAMASGSGRIRDWLVHCRDAGLNNRTTRTDGLDRVDSEFEAEVIQALRARGAETISHFPCCGFRIDIVAELDGGRIAIECDGELWHLDEHGHLRTEDLRRQEILERAGWTVVRVPYRLWMKQPDAEIERVMSVLRGDSEISLKNASDDPHDDARLLNTTHNLTRHEATIIAALKDGHRVPDDVYKAARGHLGYARLGAQIRHSLEQARASLQRRGLIHVEDGELFLDEEARSRRVEIPAEVPRPSVPRPRRRAPRRRRSRYRY
jgi:very-short-patch-repair endonuclease